MLCFTSGIRIGPIWEIRKNKSLTWIAAIACLHLGQFSSADLSVLTGFSLHSDAVHALQLIHRSVYELTIYTVLFCSPLCVTHVFIHVVMFIYVRIFGWQLQVCRVTHLSHNIPVRWHLSNLPCCLDIEANVWSSYSYASIKICHVIPKKKGPNMVCCQAFATVLERILWISVLQMIEFFIQSESSHRQSKHQLVCGLPGRCLSPASLCLQSTRWTHGTTVHFMHLCVLCKWLRKGWGGPEWRWQIICIG